MSQAQKTLLLTCLALTSFALTNGGAVQAKRNKAKPNSVSVPVYALSATDRQHLLQDNFVVVHTVQAIPKPVLSGLLGKTPLEGMADPGQPFQESDVVNGRLPFNRLIFAAVSADYCVVYYEHGGFGLGRMASLYRLTGGQASLVWLASLDRPSYCHTLDGFRGEVILGEFGSLRLQDYAQQSFQPVL